MRSRWAIFIVVYLSNVIACLNQFKVPPVMGILMQEFHVNSTTAGWLMSIFALTGIILAFPTAVILRRFGPQKSGMLALGCTILGCVVGAIATNSPFLMTGRVIEGIGLSLLTVIAPVIISMHFKGNEIGLPMGILATWYPVGSAIAYNISNPVTQAFGSWRGNWWVGVVLGLIAFVLFACVVRRPSDGETSNGHGGASISYSEELKHPKIWLLGLTFLFVVMGRMGFLTWAPKYFADAFGINPGIANFTASLGFMWGAPGGIIAGIVFKRIKNKNALIVTCAILSAMTYTFGFIVPQGIMFEYLAVTGLIMGFTAATVWAMVPGVMTSPYFIGLGMSVIAIMQGLANFLSPPFLGNFIAGNHWNEAVIPTAVIQIIGVIFAIAFVMVKSSNPSKTREINSNN
ncbi:CynX/NimT family MFS transporter [Desulfosporosinus fructosivorans]|nr:MFS transporter [Desulfosporosinus fructosivorans]